MSNLNNSSYICDKLMEISTRNCNNIYKLLDIPENNTDKLLMAEANKVRLLSTIATRDISCLKSLDMLNTCCKHYISIKYKE